MVRIMTSIANEISQQDFNPVLTNNKIYDAVQGLSTKLADRNFH